jgi:hypothetical protein
VNRQRNTIIERCELCGQPVSIDEPDAVQLHAGAVGGLVHADCLRESDDDASVTGEA